MNVEEYHTVENARVERVTVGSRAHDGRGFFSVYFGGTSWGQGINLPWDRDTVDRLIAVCGASDLADCKGKLVRVAWEHAVGTAEPIAAVFHVLKPDGLDARKGGGA